MGVTCFEEYNTLIEKNRKLEEGKMILERKISSLKNEQEELNNELDEYKMGEKDLNQKINQLESNKYKLQKELSNYKNDYRNLNRQLQETKDKNLRETQRLQNNLINAQEEVEFYRINERKLKNEQNNLRNNYDALKKDNNLKNNQIKDLEKQKDNLHKDIYSMNSKQRKLLKKNKELEEEMKHGEIKMKSQINKLKNEKSRLTEEIDDLKYDNEINEKENDDLKNQINNYKYLMQEKENNMNEQMYNLMMEKNSLNAQIQNLEYQKQIAEKEKKENENYKNYLENKIKDFILKVSKTKEINQSIEKKCNYILKIETEKIKDQIETSITKSNFLKVIENEKDREIERAINDFIIESRHINIILLGKTGVGKSELINAIAGSRIAETGGFRPMRHVGVWHEIGALRIYDNQGIEISKYNNINTVISNIQRIVDTAKKSGQPDKFVHCIWYCVTGTRFEEDEELAVRKLIEIYEDKCMPIIIVYLRAVSSEWVNNIKKGIENSFIREIEFIPVLSKDVVNEDGSIFKAKGLNTLISRTMDKVKNAIDSQSFVYVINFIQRRVQNIIVNNNYNQFNIYNNNIINSIIKFFNDIIGGLDSISKKLITENINNLQLKCKNAKFDVEVMDLMRQFLNFIDYENEFNQYENNIIKKTLYEKAKTDVEKEIKILYNKNLENYINNGFNIKIYDFYKMLIQNSSEIIVGNNLKNLKNLIVSKMKTAIENSPNFINLFNI